jgi:hypothetical protein
LIRTVFIDFGTWKFIGDERYYAAKLAASFAADQINYEIGNKLNFLNYCVERRKAATTKVLQ